MCLTVLLPAYNEECVIGGVIARIREVYPEPSVAEVLVVDDGSKDQTCAVAQAAGARVVRHPYNKGNGAAIKTGIRSARGDIIVMMDADGQHDPQDIPRLVAPIMDLGYDMVVGARVRGCQKWHRSLANTIFNVFASYVTNFHVRDLTSGFRAVRADLARQFCYLLPNTFSYPSTLTIAAIKGGYSTTYIEIQAKVRVGKSKINVLEDGVRFLIIIAKIATLFSPLKVFLPVGLLVLLPGFILAIYRLFLHRSWTLPIVISMSVGALIIMIGFLAEQIALLRLQHIDLEPRER